MSLPASLPNNIPSPCKLICQLDEHDRCVGCHRTIEEIAGWITMSNAEKLAVWDRIAELEG
jgi:predicted Fe-S protein YdhL (DUF1289 family)